MLNCFGDHVKCHRNPFSNRQHSCMVNLFRNFPYMNCLVDNDALFHGVLVQLDHDLESLR